MYPWQTRLLEKFHKYDGKELMVMAAGRSVGKSMYAQEALHRYNEYIRYKECAAWCTEMFGEYGETWWFIDGEFNFNDPKDQVLFLLRWS